jgi:hypothetical protein
MTTLFESIFSLETLQSLFGFTEYDDEGYPVDDDYMDEEELDEDLDDGFDDEDLEAEWE